MTDEVLCEVMEMYDLKPDGSKRIDLLYGFRIKGQFRTTEAYHLNNGGTRKCIEMVKMTHPQIILKTD